MVEGSLFDPLAIYIGAVQRAEVAHQPGTPLLHKNRMLARHGEVVERDVVIGHPPSADLVTAQAVSSADLSTLAHHEHHFPRRDFTTVNDGVIAIAWRIKQRISFRQHTRAQARLVDHGPTSRTKRR